MRSLNRHVSPWRLLVIISLFASAACSDADPVATATSEPSLLPNAASLTVVPSSLDFADDAAVSPSGEARVAPREGAWCLEDSAGVRCVDAEAEGSAADGIQWRPDETAIAVSWGARDPISVIDFAAGTSVETRLSRHRITAWSPDGSALLGFDLDRPGDLYLLDPVTLEGTRFAPFDSGGVPQVFWATDDVIWGSSPHIAEVFTMSAGDEPEVIEGGVGEQRLLSVTQDGRLALAMDRAVARGRAEADATALRLFDRENERSVGVDVPDSIEPNASDDAQLSADGRAILVLHQIDGGTALSSAAVDPDTLATSSWRTLVSWETGDPTIPAVYGTNGILRWIGGDTAWIISRSGELLEVSLS